MNFLELTKYTGFNSSIEEIGMLHTVCNTNIHQL